MYRKVCSLLLVSLWLAMAVAENYPYKSDYLWVTVPDHADWLYHTGQQAEIEVQFYKYGIPRDGELHYAIANDLMPADAKGTAYLRNGRCIIKAGTSEIPCFRDIRLWLKIDGTTYKHHVKIGFSPEKILPYTKAPGDFMQFWKHNIEEERKYPLSYTKEYCREYSTDKVDCYLVKFDLNRRHQSFYGYLAVPKNAKPGSCPVVLSPPGAGIKRLNAPVMRSYYPENGVIRLNIEIHGIDPRLSDAAFEDIRAAFDGRIKGYLYQGLDNREHYYMKHVYLGLLKCLDFLTSLPEWDGRNVITVGGSQGGALALIAAALDERVNLCVANHPALSDMAAAIQPGRAHGFPHFSKADGFLTETHLQTLPYYDVVCFAPYIKAKTYLTWGFNDNTCPPATSYAVWNSLRCEKQSLVTPVNEHWTSETTNRQQLEWILENIVRPLPNR